MPGVGPFHLYCLTEAGSELGPCKVGVATYPDSRLSSLQGGNHRTLRFEWISMFESRQNALDCEQHILGRLRSQAARKPLRSEWLDASPEEVWEAGRELIEAVLEVEAS